MQPGHGGTRPTDVSEDCLFANIYTPSASFDGTQPRVPIMLWVHGGGWTAGSGNSYDGTALAARENIMLAAVNYRLGVLGFYASEELVRESNATGGMNGVNDVIVALKWLYANAHRFGGDAEQLTIAGESAGAEIVCNLLVSPLATGLFRRAIIESGPCLGGVMGWGAHPRDEALAASANATQHRTLAELRAVEDAFTLLQGAQQQRTVAARDGSGASTKVEDSVDGHVLPGNMARPTDASPVFERLQSAGLLNAEAVLLGSNSYDGLQSYYVAAEANPLTGRESQLVYSYNMRGLWGADAAAVEARFPAESFPSGRNGADVRPAGDAGVTCPTLEMARLLVAAQATAYTYFFSYGPVCGDPMGSMHKTGGPGWASHASEIPWVFGTFPRCYRNSSEHRLTESMQDMWGSFVRTGEPRTSSLVWNAHEPSRGNMLLLDLVPRMVDHLKTTDCEALLGINRSLWPHLS